MILREFTEEGGGERVSGPEKVLGVGLWVSDLEKDLSSASFLFICQFRRFTLF